MKESNIIVLIGRSSTGKSTILNKLVEKYDWNNCVSYTSRKPRQGELEGKDYFFLPSNDSFDRMFDAGLMFEKTEYNVDNEIWKYGIGHDSVSETKTNCLILNVDGVSQILNSELKDRLIIIEVSANTDTLIKRYWDRSNKDEKSKVQLVDRLIRDIEDFSDINLGLIQYNVGLHKYFTICNGEDEECWTMDRIVEFIGSAVEYNE